MLDMRYLLVGTTTADLITGGRILGGTVSYAAPIVRHFGYQAHVLTSAHPHDPLLQGLHDIADMHVIASEHTTTFENIYTDSGRTQIIHHTAHKLTPVMLPAEWRSAPLVHLAPLANDVEPLFAHQFEQATVLLTPQGYMRQWGVDGVVQFKRFLDNNMLSAIDILVLSKQDIYDAPELEQEFPKYTPHVIVTDGENGGTYYHNGERYHYDAVNVQQVDPTGAGDVFAASLLASLPLLQHNMIAAIKVAARLAAHSVTVKGTAIPFTPTFIQQVLDEAMTHHD
ncbi:MAG: PfkB family carbohydrate kinase [Anaerolineae bacterium]